MKHFVMALAVTGALSGAAQASGRAYCLQSSAFLGGTECAFDTFEQCQFDRQGLGGFCSQNPEYLAPQPRVAPRRRHK